MKLRLSCINMSAFLNLGDFKSYFPQYHQLVQPTLVEKHNRTNFSPVLSSFQCVFLLDRQFWAHYPYISFQHFVCTGKNKNVHVGNSVTSKFFMLLSFLALSIFFYSTTAVHIEVIETSCSIGIICKYCVCICIMEGKAEKKRLGLWGLKSKTSVVVFLSLVSFKTCGFHAGNSGSWRWSPYILKLQRLRNTNIEDKERLW